MSDFLSSIHRAQAQWAKDQKFAERIVGTLPQFARRVLDENGWLELFTANVEAKVVAATLAYADWLATLIYRSGSYYLRPMIFCDYTRRKAIAEKTGVDLDCLKYIVSDYIEESKQYLRLPGVATIGPCMSHMIPDQSAIEEWATYFDWSQPVPVLTPKP